MTQGALTMSACGSSNAPLRARPQAAQAAAPLRSPDVQPDGRVTFRVRAPHAESVVLDLEGAPRAAMAREEGGVWTLTTAALPPDVYGYSFVVDGTDVLDPSNPAYKPSLLRPQSLLHVTGPSPMPWDVTDVPRGAVHEHFYRSAVAGDERDLFVYTPPGYDAAPARRYPVLYLLHGFSDDARAWTAVGRANVVLDNLIAAGRAVPMVVVMPLGYGAPEILAGGFAGFARDEGLRRRNFDRFRDTLLAEVVPRVEALYRVRTDAGGAAIAGLSMGGAEALRTALNDPGAFSYVGAFSSGGLGDDFDADFPRLGRDPGEAPRLLWISCGTSDPLFEANVRLRTFLASRGLAPTSVDTPGGHTWRVWRRNLVDFVPLLFHAGDARSPDH